MKQKIVFKRNKRVSRWLRFVSWSYVVFVNYISPLIPIRLYSIEYKLDNKWLNYIYSLSIYDWPEE